MSSNIDTLKKKSPGVPANTCPYVDEVIRMIGELEESYNILADTGVKEPLFEKRCQIAIDTLEYIRESNELLRNNSYFWYSKCKTALAKKKA